MNVEVETRATRYTAGRDPVTIKQIDWNDSSDRKWLVNHLHWAMNNDKTVSLSPESN